MKERMGRKGKWIDFGDKMMNDWMDESTNAFNRNPKDGDLEHVPSILSSSSVSLVSVFFFFFALFHFQIPQIDASPATTVFDEQMIFLFSRRFLIHTLTHSHTRT